jgi:hypothetical protein
MDYYDYNYTMFINYYLRVVLLCVLLFEFHSHLENKSRVNTLSGWYDEIQKKMNTFGAVGWINDPKNGKHTQETISHAKRKLFINHNFVVKQEWS